MTDLITTTPTTPTSTPEAGAFSRRSMLRGLSLAGLGGLFGPSLLNSGAAFAAGPTHKPRAKKALSSGPYEPPKPFQLQASSQLSEDFFLTGDVLIGRNDRVMPFVNPHNGAVEAVVFSNGALHHLYRNPSVSTGWSYQAIGLQNLLSNVTDVAIAANGSKVYMLVFGDPDEDGNPDGAPAWLTQLSDAVTWAAGDLVSYDDLQYTADANAGPIKGGISPDGSTCYFYTALADGTILGWVATGNTNGDPLTYQQYKSVDTDNTSLVDYLVLLDQTVQTGSNPAWNGFVLTYTSDGTMSVFNQSANVGKAPDADVFNASPNENLGTTGATALLWTWTANGSTTGNPGYAVQTSSGVGFSDLNGNYNTLTAQNALTADQTAVWLQNDLYTVNMLDDDGTINTVQEISGAGTGSWGTPLPVTTQDQGFVAIYGVPTDPTQSTLFAVGADETLSALTLDDTGWTQTQIKQDSQYLEPIDSYRVQVSVQDANGTPLPLAEVTVSSDRLVGIWQPEGSTILIPDTSVTMTADTRGQLTFSVPAQELDTAVLTVIAVGKDKLLSEPLQVIGDYDVRSFLQGTGPLTHLGQLTGSAMIAATDDSGSPVFSALANQPDAANQCVNALNAIVTAGTATAPSGSQPQSILIDTSSGTPSSQSSSSPTAYPAPSGKSIGDDFKHLFDSIGHALRHAAAKLQQVVVRWASDVGRWVVDMAVQIGDDIYSIANQTIADMQDAFHVIGGFFHALGADIVAAVDWLKHNVTKLLAATNTNAAYIEKWLSLAPQEINTVIDEIEIDTDTFFSDKQAAFDTAIAECANAVEQVTFGSSVPLPPPKTDTGTSKAEADLQKTISAIGKVINDLPGNWLLDKLMKCLGDESTANQLIDAFQQPINDLATDFVDALDVGSAFGTAIGQTGKTFATRSGFTEQNMSDWFGDVRTLVDSILTLADKIVDTVLDLIKAVLDNLVTVLTSYMIDFGAALGPELTAILDEFKIDLKMTTAHLVGLVIGFPASLIAQIRGLDSLFPTTSASQGKVGDSEPSWEVGLGIAAAVTQVIWGLNDIVGDVASLGGPDGEKYATPAACAWIDIIAPLALVALQWPTEDVNGKVEPFSGGLRHGGANDWMLTYTIVTAVIPPGFDLLVKLMPLNSGTNEPSPEGSENPMSDYYSPIVQGLCALPNTVLSSLYCARTDGGAASITASVLGNLSYNFALLLTTWVQNSTEKTSVVAKALLDAIGNIGAAIAMAEAATLPPR